MFPTHVPVMDMCHMYIVKLDVCCAQYCETSRLHGHSACTSDNASAVNDTTVLYVSQFAWNTIRTIWPLVSTQCSLL